MPPQQPLRHTVLAPQGRMGQAIAAAVAKDNNSRRSDHGDVLAISRPPARRQGASTARFGGIPILAAPGLAPRQRRIAPPPSGSPSSSPQNPLGSPCFRTWSNETGGAGLSGKWKSRKSTRERPTLTGTACVGRGAERGAAPPQAQRGRDGTPQARPARSATIYPRRHRRRRPACTPRSRRAVGPVAPRRERASCPRALAARVSSRPPEGLPMRDVVERCEQAQSFRILRRRRSQPDPTTSSNTKSLKLMVGSRA